MSIWKWKPNRQRARSAAKRIIRTQNLDETPMNHVETARPRAEFFLMFAACGVSSEVFLSTL